MLDQTNIDAITETDLARLVENRVSEGRTLEFKQEFPGASDGDTKDFLHEVTALANAQGGDLLFGIAETAGIATEIRGVAVDDWDAALLRLENMLRDGISPRLNGTRLRWVDLASGRRALVLRIPASLSAPHQVSKSGRFYSRNSAGKFPMDVHDLRHAFTESSSLPARFRTLHSQAIMRAGGEEMPLGLVPNPSAVVSVMPLTLFRQERDIPITREQAMLPIDATAYSGIDLIEGTLMHSRQNEAGAVSSLAITYRTGRVDTAWTIGGPTQWNGQLHYDIEPAKFERGLLDAAISPQARLRQFGIEGPWVVFVSVYRVGGYRLNLGTRPSDQPTRRKHCLQNCEWTTSQRTD